mgnify:CR=1 FL=1
MNPNVEGDTVAIQMHLPPDVANEAIKAGFAEPGPSVRFRSDLDAITQVLVVVAGATASLVTVTADGPEALRWLAGSLSRRFKRRRREDEITTIVVRSPGLRVEMELDAKTDADSIVSFLRKVIEQRSHCGDAE